MRPVANIMERIEEGELIEPHRGPGRPKGRVSKRTELSRRLAEQSLEEARSPLHVMLGNIQFYLAEAHRLESELALMPQEPLGISDRAERRRKVKALVAVRELAEEAARDAAPYCHPKLNSIAVANEGGEPFILVLAPGEEKL